MQIGVFGLLTIIMFICKLAGVISWSWWIVFSPLLVGVGLAVLFLVAAIIFVAVTDT